jgi:plastocyanin
MRTRLRSMGALAFGTGILLTLLACSDDTTPTYQDGKIKDGGKDMAKSDMSMVDMSKMEGSPAEAGKTHEAGKADAPKPMDSLAPEVDVVSCTGVTPNAEVQMKNIAFDPPSVTISMGQIVRWTNMDSVPHTVTSGQPGAPDAGKIFDSGNLNQNDTYCLRFNIKKTYQYYCKVHPTTMNNGMVTVQ